MQLLLIGIAGAAGARIGPAATYVGISTIGGLAAAAAGYFSGRLLA